VLYLQLILECWLADVPVRGGAIWVAAAEGTPATTFAEVSGQIKYEPERRGRGRHVHNSPIIGTGSIGTFTHGVT
jgi:hypothetical protein